MGGSGMTLGLIIAIFLVSRRKDYRTIAKMALVPGLFNINEPLMFGLPIVLNSIMAVPFVLTPVVNILIGYMVTVVFNWMPTPAIGMSWTTPGPLMPFLGTGGNLMGLVMGVVCLAVSVMMYFPFVLAANRMAAPADEDSKEDKKAEIEKDAKKENLFKEVLEEIPRVRKEMGYPPLVTPMSQMVGTQAVMNVISGERYKMVPKEIKDYVGGLYGQAPAPLDSDIVKIVNGDNTIITERPADLLAPQLDQFRKDRKSTRLNSSH